MKHTLIRMQSGPFIHLNSQAYTTLELYYYFTRELGHTSLLLSLPRYKG